MASNPRAPALHPGARACDCEARSTSAQRSALPGPTIGNVFNTLRAALLFKTLSLEKLSARLSGADENLKGQTNFLAQREVEDSERESPLDHPAIQVRVRSMDLAGIVARSGQAPAGVVT